MSGQGSAAMQFSNVFLKSPARCPVLWPDHARAYQRSNPEASIIERIGLSCASNLMRVFIKLTGPTQPYEWY